MHGSAWYKLNHIFLDFIGLDLRPAQSISHNDGQSVCLRLRVSQQPAIHKSFALKVKDNKYALKDSNIYCKHFNDKLFDDQIFFFSMQDVFLMKKKNA